MRVNEVVIAFILVLIVHTSVFSSEIDIQKKRFALVIGNADYKTARLERPLIDADGVAKALSELNFEVVYIKNASRDIMIKSVQELGEQLKNGGIGLFYFSGHGLQYKDKNYLLPIGANIETERELEFEAVNADMIVYRMSTNEKAIKIVILDACREYPIIRKTKTKLTGLSSKIDVPSGTFIAYATSPDDVAIDGIYAEHFLRNINSIGLKIEEVFKNIRRGVIAETGGEQVPWDLSSLTVDCYFIPLNSLKTETEKVKPIQEPIIRVRPGGEGRIKTFAYDSLYYKEYLSSYIERLSSTNPNVNIKEVILSYNENESFIDRNACLGCLSCLTIIPFYASVQYNYGVSFEMKGKVEYKGKLIFINENYSQMNSYRPLSYDEDERKSICTIGLNAVIEKFENSLKMKIAYLE